MRSALPILAALAGCSGMASPVPPRPHYLLGGAYPAGGVWYYPARNFRETETGLAAVQPDDHPPLTADGEAFDQDAITAAHQTLQLPAIADLTNLENGRTILLRVNDRGPPSPARLVAVTRRVATSLGFNAAGVARVRLTVLEGPSRAAVEALGGDPADHLAISAAPRGEVQQDALAPPAGTAAAPTVRRAFATIAVPAGEPERIPAPPSDRLSPVVRQSAPEPGSLWVRLGRFSRREFADRQATRIAALGPVIEHSGIGSGETWRVGIGPLGNVAAADRVLAQVIRAGILDARIVVE